MINLPIASRIAFRGVAFYQHDAGYIDNIFGIPHLLRHDDLPIPTGDSIGCVNNGIHVTNAGLEKKNFNDETSMAAAPR